LQAFSGQRDVCHVLRYREDTDGPERDPLPTTAFIDENHLLTCGARPSSLLLTFVPVLRCLRLYVVAGCAPGRDSAPGWCDRMSPRPHGYESV
jgi:hypothetical protein